MNLGPKTHCEACGAPRPKNVKFYLPSDAEIVQDEAQLAAARAGADWICGHCGGHNKTAHTECQSCGNPRDELSEDVELAVKEYALNEVPNEGLRKEDQPGERYRALRKQQAGKPFAKFNTLVKVALFGGLLALLAGWLLLLAFPKAIEVEVSGFRWQRNIQFERYEAVQEEAWQVPQGAFNVSSFRAIHHYKRVSRGYETRTRQVRVKVGEERYVCGQRDLGNGYFEDRYCTRPIYDYRQETYQEEVFDDVPVYKTKYRYYIKKWNRKPEYKRHTAGMDHQPKWPELPGPSTEWREGPKSERYFITVKEPNGRTHEVEVGPRFWEGLREHERLPAAKMRIFGTFRGITHPEKDK